MSKSNQSVHGFWICTVKKTNNSSHQHIGTEKYSLTKEYSQIKDTKVWFHEVFQWDQLHHTARKDIQSNMLFIVLITCNYLGGGGGEGLKPVKMLNGYFVHMPNPIAQKNV